MEQRTDGLPDWGVRIESHRHGPGFRTARHAHPFHSLIYAISGQGSCILRDGECPLFAGAAVLLDKGEEHQLIDRPRSPMVVYVLYFLADRSPDSKEIVGELLAAPRPIATPLPYARPIRATLRQTLHEQSTRPLHYRTAIQLGLDTVLLQLRRAMEESGDRDGRRMDGSDRVREVLEFVAARPYDHHSLADAARMAGLSQRQFTNLCRRETGDSYLQHVNALRVERARHLLETTDMPVSAVAFEVGFEELSTFYRAFRKITGRRPLDLRSSVAPEHELHTVKNL